MMHAASREALAQVAKQLDEALTHAGQEVVGVAAQLGAELFDVVEALDGDRALRIAVADPSLDAKQRGEIVRSIFGSKVHEGTLEVLVTASSKTWSNAKEYREGLVALGRRALLRSAKEQGQLGTVEDELFRLSRLLLKEPELTLLLDDDAAPAQQKRSLLASVLYGKVTAVTEALALQAVGRPERNSIDDLNALSSAAAEFENRAVAHVVSASELNDAQREALGAKLHRIYGREISIHSEVDPSLLGGMVIRVGDEVIDGSTAGKLERLRTQLV